MKLIELEIHNIRGIRELKLHPDGKNLVICGPNGTGKSAIVDAIDFLLTGNMSRLTGKGTAGITVRKHGHHLAAQPKDAYVRAVVQVDNQRLELRRSMAKENELECPGGNWALVEPALHLATLGHHRLTRREILRFITAESSARADEVAQLLNIQEIDAVRKAIGSAARAIETRRKEVERNLDRQTSVVCASLGLRELELGAAWDVINGWRSTLGGQLLQERDLRALKLGLVPPAQTGGNGVGRSQLQAQFSRVYEVYHQEAVESRRQTYERMQEIARRLEANPRLLEDIRAVELVRMGIDLLDSTGRCPLCLAVHEPAALDSLLHGRLLAASEALQIQVEVRQILADVNVSAEMVKGALSEFAQAAAEAGLPGEREALMSWSLQVDRWQADLQRGSEQYRWPTGVESFQQLGLPADFMAGLARITGALMESSPEISSEQAAWDALTKLDVELNHWYQARQDAAQAWKQVQAASKLKDAYERARQAVLDDLYGQISARFTELYRCLHPEDEGNFSAELTPSGAGLQFNVDFHGLGAHPPHALHSEGHQDSMGVCLFLALAERLTQGALDLVVLDDVVMSVDIDHRQQLCRLLNERYSHRQLIITTHDSVWATQLRKAGVVTEKGLVKLTGWSYETGPQLGEMVDLWQQIDRDLACGDIHAAAARLRRGLEEFAYHACDALQAKVRFSMDLRWELGDVLPAAVGRYRDCLKQGKSAAHSWGREELFTRFSKQEAAFTEICTQSDVERWTVNPSVHYNAWANFSLGEFRQTVAAQRALVEQFYCPECGGLIYLVEEGKTEVGVRCPCAAIHWNLAKKLK